MIAGKRLAASVFARKAAKKQARRASSREGFISWGEAQGDVFFIKCKTFVTKSLAGERCLGPDCAPTHRFEVPDSVGIGEPPSA
jgi:hypothetical protein